MVEGDATNGKNGPTKHAMIIALKTPRLTSAGLFLDNRCHASCQSELPCDLFIVSSDTQAN
jgi:hypothetical protein